MRACRLSDEAQSNPNFFSELEGDVRGECSKQGAVLSPMPGKLVKLLVQAGQPVKAGEPLLVLEAMKMEHTLRASADAVVEKTFGREGEVVAQRAVLVSFATKEPGS